MKDNYLTVTQLSKYLKYKFDEDNNLKKVYLKGEISNFKAHTRGHYYFTLKDENSRINAVMFATSTRNIKFLPQDGMKVMVTGRVTVYEATGGYQIYVDNMLEDGVGNLYVAFEQLKKKLASEGLFDVSHKRKIVKMPKKIGIVTASTGAAIRDIMTTIKRRYPICETILFPSLVQGSDAARDIVSKIELANTYDIDTLIVGRGGGSIEDLWPFNEEIVARAIYNSRVPVISGVGHEIDFTISDFVADLRAATPTAAAELAVPDIHTILDYLENAKTRSYNAISNLILSLNMKLDKISTSYVLKNPNNMYEVKEQQLDVLIDKLNDSMLRLIENNKIKLYTLSNSYILNNPEMLYKIKLEKLDHLTSKIILLNPMETLKRGYGILRKDDKVISSVKDINKDDELMMQLKDGNVLTKVVKVSE
jgi:exodeoxyribonuclease VII large subunit